VRRCAEIASDVARADELNAGGVAEGSRWLSAERDTTGCAATDRRTPAGVPDSWRFWHPSRGAISARIPILSPRGSRRVPEGRMRGVSLKARLLNGAIPDAREGARHNIAPGSARGNQIAARLCGREGGRYNLRKRSPLVVAAFAATTIWGSIVPRAEPGATLCRAPSRANALPIDFFEGSEDDSSHCQSISSQALRL